MTVLLVLWLFGPALQAPTRPPVSQLAASGVAERRATIEGVVKRITQPAPIDRPTIENLFVALEDPDSVVRRTAFGGLGFMAMRNAGTRSSGKAPPLTATDQERLGPIVRAALQDSDEQIRAFAVNALTLVFSDDAGLESALAAEYARDSSPSVRRQAIARLREIVSLSSVGQALLIKALGDQNSGVRQQAALGLGQHKPPAGLAALVSALTAEPSPPSVTGSVVSAIGAYGGAAIPYIAVLEAARVAEIDPAVRAEFDRVLIQLRGR